MDNSNLLHLNFDKYKEFLVDSPRNYSVILMLTALSHKRGCHQCQAASDEFNVIAVSYSLLKEHKNLFFAVADYDEDSKIFTDLNQNTVPVFIHFPPTGSPREADMFDVSRNGFNAEALAKWIFMKTDVNVIPQLSRVILLDTN
ncbi:unnamed protein product [Mesocestoides corti]|uniref:Thioredoxin domain-containing protein n=1 Tax=Mesocestoides corti TaxID=53468 RepID=A0A3P6HQJ5_MESCO|nr:unnamed protein product [Mesocestoides corti]